MTFLLPPGFKGLSKTDAFVTTNDGAVVGKHWFYKKPLIKIEDERYRKFTRKKLWHL